METKSDWKLIGFFISLYILTLPLNGLLELPIVIKKIQLPEIAFIILFFLTIVKVFQTKLWLKWQISIIDKALILYFLAMLLSASFHPTRASFFEVLGLAYLIFLYVIMNFYFIGSEKNIRSFLVQNVLISGIFTSIIAFLGGVLLLFGTENRSMPYFENYPIFGNIHRMSALAEEPIMLMSILGIFILIIVADNLNKPRNSKIFIALTLMTLVCILTFTKSFAMLIASIIGMLSYHFRILERVKSLIWVGILSIFLFLSHFSFVSKLNFERNIYCHALEKQPFQELENSYLLRTCYGVLKDMNMIAFFRHPLVGVGGGNFSDYIKQLKNEGIYPTYLSNFDPLSTYFGALSELGTIGFMALIALYYAIFLTWKRVAFSNFEQHEDTPFWILLGGVLLFMLSEGFVTDTMNFRHYWVVVAFLAARGRR